MKIWEIMPLYHIFGLLKLSLESMVDSQHDFWTSILSCLMFFLGTCANEVHV